jgi:UDP-N-acetylmuramate-alanine ligase
LFYAGIRIPIRIQPVITFTGGKGRKGEKKEILIVDDYGHHPVEIMATLKRLKDGTINLEGLLKPGAGPAEKASASPRDG